MEMVERRVEGKIIPVLSSTKSWWTYRVGIFDPLTVSAARNLEKHNG